MSSILRRAQAALRAAQRTRDNPRARKPRPGAGLPPGFPYPCENKLVGSRASGETYAGEIIGCATPPTGKHGHWVWVGGKPVSVGQVGRDKKSKALRAGRAAERYAGPDYEPVARPVRVRGMLPPPPVRWFGTGPGTFEPGHAREPAMARYAGHSTMERGIIPPRPARMGEAREPMWGAPLPPPRVAPVPASRLSADELGAIFRARMGKPRGNPRGYRARSWR